MNSKLLDGILVISSIFSLGYHLTWSVLLGLLVDLQDLLNYFNLGFNFLGFLTIFVFLALLHSDDDFLQSVERVGKIVFLVLVLEISISLLYLIPSFTPESVISLYFGLYFIQAIIAIVPIIYVFNFDVTSQAQSNIQALLMGVFVGFFLAVLPHDFVFREEPVMNLVASLGFDLLFYGLLYVTKIKVEGYNSSESQNSN